MTTTLTPSARLARTGSLGPLSAEIIPATPGTFYVYQAMFTKSDPLYALLDCKANKSRSIMAADELGCHVHAHFEFVGTALAKVSSIKAAQAAGKLGHCAAQFEDVYLAVAGIPIEDFYNLSARRDSAKLTDVCKAACSRQETSVDVTPGVVMALMTSAGKCGLFLVQGLSHESASIEACHFQLP